MRKFFHKLLLSLEVAAEKTMYAIAYTMFSPFIFITYCFCFVAATYSYIKYMNLSFDECFRYEMTDTQSYEDLYPDRFVFYYNPKRKFDLDEWKRVRSII